LNSIKLEAVSTEVNPKIEEVNPKIFRMLSRRKRCGVKNPTAGRVAVN
jgi:hypothetical protein